MKAVKFVFSGKYGPSLTYGKIYDVLNCRINRFDKHIRPIILIKNDFGEDVEYFMMGSNVWFEDATSYIRDEKLNELGI